MTDKAKAMVLMDKRGVQLGNIDEAFRFAQAVAASGLAPKGMDRAEQILIALQAGAELGLTPMRSLSSVVVVNGRVSLMGDAAKAIVRRDNLLEPGTDFSEHTEGEGDDQRAVVTAHRKGSREPVFSTFSVRQAKRARLWGKSGPWSDYPERMLKYRALGFLLRDHFSDALMGLAVAEEVADIPVAPARQLAPPPEPDPLMAALEASVARPMGVVEGEAKAAEACEHEFEEGACLHCGEADPRPPSVIRKLAEAKP